jgi:kinesin family protein 3/17
MFAYGQTGCGKSFTMEGVSNPPELSGVTPRSFSKIFNAIDNADDGTQFLVSVAFIEIYNDDVR